MPRQSEVASRSMIDLVGSAIAEADGADFQTDPNRYRRLAMAALAPLATPAEGIVDAAHAAASFDAQWAINSRRDFRRAVKAMIAQVQRQ